MQECVTLVQNNFFIEKEIVQDNESSNHIQDKIDKKVDLKLQIVNFKNI